MDKPHIGEFSKLGYGAWKVREYLTMSPCANGFDVGFKGLSHDRVPGQRVGRKIIQPAPTLEYKGKSNPQKLGLRLGVRHGPAGTDAHGWYNWVILTLELEGSNLRVIRPVQGLKGYRHTAIQIGHKKQNGLSG